jgi:hypothetical protein
MAYQNINYITKEWPLHECDTSDTSDTCHIQNIKNNGQPIVQYITTVASSFGCNIPSTKLQSHHPQPVYLRPKKDHRYSCGFSHIRIGEGMSSPPQQYKTH